MYFQTKTVFHFQLLESCLVKDIQIMITLGLWVGLAHVHYGMHYGCEGGGEHYVYVRIRINILVASRAPFRIYIFLFFIPLKWNKMAEQKTKNYVMLYSVQ